MNRLKQRIENFKKVFTIFEQAVKEYQREKILTHMALIQCFEITFEIAWKILKDYLKIKGVEAKFPKDVIKEAFSFELLKNGQVWIDMLNDRNISSHEYNQDRIDLIIVRISEDYYKELSRFAKDVESWDEV